MMLGLRLSLLCTREYRRVGAEKSGKLRVFLHERPTAEAAQEWVA